MERLLAEEVAVSTISVERVAGSSVVCVGRTHVGCGGGGGGHFGREMRCNGSSAGRPATDRAKFVSDAASKMSEVAVASGARTTKIESPGGDGRQRSAATVDGRHHQGWARRRRRIITGWLVGSERASERTGACLSCVAERAAAQASSLRWCNERERREHCAPLLAPLFVRRSADGGLLPQNSLMRPA